MMIIPRKVWPNLAPYYKQDTKYKYLIIFLYFWLHTKNNRYRNLMVSTPPPPNLWKLKNSKITSFFILISNFSEILSIKKDAFSGWLESLEIVWPHYCYLNTWVHCILSCTRIWCIGTWCTKYSFSTKVQCICTWIR
jgi:hypothetical protein